MKKMIIISLLMFISSFYYQYAQASDYLTYQEITFEHSGAKMLEKYSNSDYDKYYSKMEKRRFWGWRTYVAYENEKAYFIKETLYVIENHGETAIIETFSFKSEEDLKKQYSVTGTIGLNLKGQDSGYKLGLEQQLKHSITTTHSKAIEEEFEIKVYVDPMTKLVVRIEGEGKVSNGVAKYYRFYKNVKKGGWEIFIVTTEYYSLVKVKIDED